MKEPYMEDTIDLMEIFFLFWRKWWLILISGILCGALALGGTKLLITPQYESSAMIYLLSKNNAITSALDLQLSTQITEDFAILAKSRPVVGKVIKKNNLDLTYEQMVGKIRVENPANTQILKLTITDADPELSKQLANDLALAVSDQVASIMNTDRPKVVESAVTPNEPASPSLKKNTLFGVLIGMILVMGVLLIQDMLNDTIKTEEDIQKYLNMNTLATIPLVDQRSVKKAAKRKQSVKKGSRPE